MAEINPVEYFSTAASNTADMLRRAQKVLRLTQGVAQSGDLAVVQNGTPNMSVNVAAGQAVIDGTENAVLQGSYVVTNDAVVNKAIAASDPTNPRNDLVIAKVQDAAYSGGTTAWSIAVVTGTPAGSPVDPAVPANSITLARVRVDATVTSIVNAKITDLRVAVQGAIFPTATGWTLYDSTAALKNASVTDAGIWTLRNALAIPPAINGTLPTTGYGTLPVVIDYQTVSGVASIVIPPAGSLPSGFRHLKIMWKLKSSAAVVAENLLLRFNASAATNYVDEYDSVLNGVVTGVEDNTTPISGGQVGVVPGTTAPANSFGTGVIEIFDYNSATDHKTWIFHSVNRRATGASGMQTQSGGGAWIIAPTAITSMSLICNTGLATGSVTTQGTP